MRPPRAVPRSAGGGGGIRTHEAHRLDVFKTSALNRSATPPGVPALRAMWQAGQESNLQPADLEAAALPIELPAFTPRDDTIPFFPLQPLRARSRACRADAAFAARGGVWGGYAGGERTVLQGASSRRAEALGYAYEGNLRGRSSPRRRALHRLARGFSRRAGGRARLYVTPATPRTCSHFSWERGHLARVDATRAGRPRSQARRRVLLPRV